MNERTASVPRQRLTRDYLAKQLPIFQERVPKSAQGPLKFPTNAPANLPTPPLLPGEEVQLQQHRVVCTEVFQDPAVGTLYITNFRVIFNGNSIKDPDSLEALMEAQYSTKKDSISAEASAGTWTLRRQRTPAAGEPSFSSYLTNQDLGPNSAGSSASGPAAQMSKFLNFGRRKFDSFRRSPRRGSSDPSLVDASSPPPVPEASAVRLGDGEEVDGGGGGVNRLGKRKGFTYSFSQDTLSVDSASISSQSEVSEYQPDERASRMTSPPHDTEDGSHLFYSGPVDYFSANSTQSAATHNPARTVPIPEFRPQSGDADGRAAAHFNSFTTLDSGINMAVSQDTFLLSASDPEAGAEENNVFSAGRTGKDRDSDVSGEVKEGEGEEDAERTPVLAVKHVHRKNTTGEKEEEPDFERTLSPAMETNVELKRQLLESGDFYRQSGTYLAPDSDSDGIEMDGEAKVRKEEAEEEEGEKYWVIKEEGSAHDIVPSSPLKAAALGVEHDAVAPQSGTHSELNTLTSLEHDEGIPALSKSLPHSCCTANSVHSPRSSSRPVARTRNMSEGLPLSATVRHKARYRRPPPTPPTSSTTSAPLTSTTGALPATSTTGAMPTTSTTGTTATTSTTGATPTTSTTGATPTASTTGATPTTSTTGATSTASTTGATPTTSTSDATPPPSTTGATPTTSTTGAMPTTSTTDATPPPSTTGASPTTSTTGATPITSMTGATPTTSFTASVTSSTFPTSTPPTSSTTSAPTSSLPTAHARRPADKASGALASTETLPPLPPFKVSPGLNRRQILPQHRYSPAFTKPRSASFSPARRKKPVPLPRMSIKRKPLCDIESGVLVASLPANFSPTWTEGAKGIVALSGVSSSSNTVDGVGVVQGGEGSVQIDSSGPNAFTECLEEEEGVGGATAPLSDVPGGTVPPALLNQVEGEVTRGGEVVLVPGAEPADSTLASLPGLSCMAEECKSNEKLAQVKDLMLSVATDSSNDTAVASSLPSTFAHKLERLPASAVSTLPRAKPLPPVPPPRQRRKSKKGTHRISSSGSLDSGSGSSSANTSPEHAHPALVHNGHVDAPPTASYHSPGLEAPAPEDSSSCLSGIPAVVVVANGSLSSFHPARPMPSAAVAGHRHRSSTEVLQTLPTPSVGLATEDDQDDHSRVSMITNRSSVTTQRPYSAALSPDTHGSFPYGAGDPNTWSPRLRGKFGAAVLPTSTRYTLGISFPLTAVHSIRKIPPIFIRDLGVRLPDGLFILCRNFHSMKLHIHPHNTYDSDGLRELLERHFLVPRPIYQSFAFRYCAAIHHPNPTFISNQSLPNCFHLSDEMDRLGLLDSKLWRVTRILQEHPDICPTYPDRLIVSIVTPDLDLIRGAKFYKAGRFPTLSWVDKESGAAILRAAVTTSDRGQTSSSLELDRALLQAVCACNGSATGDAKLYIFTEKTDSSGLLLTVEDTGTLKLVWFRVQDADPMHINLTAQQHRSYYYPNCKFVYTDIPATFKSIRHSFNKLQAMLESNLPDEDYLLALDTTHWLTLVGELLQTAIRVCHAVLEEKAHALVSFEHGFDRTTQVVSLAQVIADPYYRTMDGFQVLVQKEWLWFGHAFCSRQHRKGRVKSDGPIFMQWMDCVWQMMRQCPSAFEFNEKLLLSLVEHSYSSQFGTFLMNNDRERKECFKEKGYEHMTVSSHSVSFWTSVSMINAAGRTFFNDLYDPTVYPREAYPRYAVPSLKLWTSHYCKFKLQEVTPFHPLKTLLDHLLSQFKLLQVTSRTPLDESSPSQPLFQPQLHSLRDESQEWTRRENCSPMLQSRSSNTRQHQRAKNKPPSVPSVGQAASTKQQYDSIEQFLRQEGYDPTVCKHLELTATACQGYLVKLGGVRKNWRKRWFVLDFNCQYLAYFEDQESCMSKEEPKGVIPLNEISSVFQNIKRRDHLVNNIISVSTPKRTYLFQAPSIITMELWMACLNMPVSSLQLHHHTHKSIH